MSPSSRPTAAAPPAPAASRAVEEALDEIRLGHPVVLVDNVRRASEGTLMVASDFVTDETIAFLAAHGRGLICLCLTAERCDALGLQPMARTNSSSFKTDFRISIEAREGVSTGVSAADRARTIQVAVDPARDRRDLVSPGHVFPLRAEHGGVLRRPGRTEAAVDLARLAGVTPATVVCELLNADGTAARGAEVVRWCKSRGLRHVAISDLLEYRRRREWLVERVSSSQLPTGHGAFAAIVYRELFTSRQHLALVRGNPSGAATTVVSVHVACLTGDVFHSLRCGCGSRLESALSRIATEEHAVLVYLGENDAGVGGEPCGGLAARRSLDGGEQGRFTYQILADLGISDIRLLTDDPELTECAERYGVAVRELIPLGRSAAVAG